MKTQKSALCKSIRAQLEAHCYRRAVWEVLLKQADALDYHEQLFQLVREQNDEAIICILRHAIMNAYEASALRGDAKANDVILAFARTMNDKELLARFPKKSPTKSDPVSATGRLIRRLGRGSTPSVN